MMFFNRNSYKSLSDEEIISLYLTNKESKIIDEFYKRYSHLVFGVCLKYLKQKENAEDTTLEIFNQIGNKIEKHSIQNFKSWLFTITKNTCLMQLRKKNPQFIEIDNAHVSEDYYDSLKSKEINELKLNLLEEALIELNTDQHYCIRAFYLEKKSYDEIVKDSNYSLNEVKSFIQNGKRNLKIILTKRYATL
jgi:RNA polymerase sigma-70 factor (ECF subfamily)